MNLLVGTHIWLWRLLEPERLSESVETLIAERTNSLHLSPVSVWEALVLARKGRVVLRPDSLTWAREALRVSHATMVPLTHDIAMRSEDLAGFGSEDPADRFLVATAIVEDLTLVTVDPALEDLTLVTVDPAVEDLTLVTVDPALAYDGVRTAS